MAAVTRAGTTPRVASRRTGVAAYLAIAFGLAWLPFVPMLFGGRPVGLLLMPVAPAVACLVVRRWVTREGFAELGLGISLRRIARLWLPVAVTLVWPFLAAPLGGLLAGQPGIAIDPVTAVGWVALSVVVAPVILGEELGWRGYLQLRVFPARPLRAAVATGLLWGVWHYPLLLAAGPTTPLMVVGFTAGTVTMSVFLGWIQHRTGSVWAPSLGHASNNVTEDNLTRAGFGPGSLSASNSVSVLVAEAFVLLGIVAFDSCTRRQGARCSPRVGGRLTGACLDDPIGPTRGTIAQLRLKLRLEKPAP